MALWQDAPPTMLGKMKLNVGDMSWDKGAWVSNWIRGRTAELEYGSYTSSGRGSRWSKATKKDLENSGALADCPIRFQVRDIVPSKKGNVNSLVTGDTGGRRQEAVLDSGRTALPFWRRDKQVPWVCGRSPKIPSGDIDAGEEPRALISLAAIKSLNGNGNRLRT